MPEQIRRDAHGLILKTRNRNAVWISAAAQGQGDAIRGVAVFHP